MFILLDMIVLFCNYFNEPIYDGKLNPHATKLNDTLHDNNMMYIFKRHHKYVGESRMTFA
ncbi:protein of unknown function [Candidatus Nitrosocosmicus franklandus]|uniref:Uncharacterized protein n=1 Tax=Candidatus Nitrosocosmicus franklandianus TaxID=1798806 RepID=A0A484I937_9ARCH|nr:protein of unknown function [Candidatus Nitrosocosmicus franklandus]